MTTAQAASRFATKLQNRGIVRVSGNDSLKLLQSLVTADIHALCPPDVLSTACAFLNRRGRVLFGALIHSEAPNNYMIDLPAKRIGAFLNHLKMFRMRSDVEIEDVTTDFSVWQFVGDCKETVPSGVGPDPRLSVLGMRGILPKEFALDDRVEVKSDDAYSQLRIIKGVPDDTDFDSTALPLDLGLHLINGVSFSKGCYLGQELTARSHFTGVLRKRLTTLLVTNEDSHLSDVSTVISEDQAIERINTDSACRLSEGAEIVVDGSTKPVGHVSSAINNAGVAILRMSDALDSRKVLRLRDGRRIQTVQQKWWDQTIAD